MVRLFLSWHFFLPNFKTEVQLSENQVATLKHLYFNSFNCLLLPLVSGDWFPEPPFKTLQLLTITQERFCICAFTWVDALNHLHARLSIGQGLNMCGLCLGRRAVHAIGCRARQVHDVRPQRRSCLLRLLRLLWGRRWRRAWIYGLSPQMPLTPVLAPLLLPPLSLTVPLLPLPAAGLATRGRSLRGWQLARGSTVRRPREGIASKGSVSGAQPPPLLLDHVLPAVVGVGAGGVALLTLLPVPRPGGRHPGRGVAGRGASCIRASSAGVPAPATGRGRATEATVEQVSWPQSTASHGGE